MEIETRARQHLGSPANATLHIELQNYVCKCACVQVDFCFSGQRVFSKGLILKEPKSSLVLGIAEGRCGQPYGGGGLN